MDVTSVVTNYLGRTFINGQETTNTIAYGDQFGAVTNGGPPYSTNYSTTNLVRLGKNYNWQQAANGLSLDDLRIYNRILSPAEITNIYLWRGQTNQPQSTTELNATTLNISGSFRLTPTP